MLFLRNTLRTAQFTTTSCHLPHTTYKRNYSALWSSAQSLYGAQQQRQKPHSGNPFRKQQRFASTEVGDAVSHAAVETHSTALIGFWQTLSNSTPVAYVQEGLTAVHDYSGLPWWATIVLSTVVFRSLITLPLTIYQQKITARIELITLEMPPLVAELKKEAAIAMKQYKWTEQKTRMIYNHSLKKQWNKLVVRENCHPAKTLIVLWGQIPLWICQSVALRNLVHMLPDPGSLQAQLIFTELTLGGFGWIPNLTEVDASYILPVALGILNLGIIEMQSMLRTRPASRLQNLATNAFRVLSVVMVPVACSVPSALCVYWVASSSYGLAQNLFLLSPPVRRAFGIPLTNSEFAQPYEHLWQTILVRTGQIEAALKTVETTKTTLTEKSVEPKDKKQQQA